MSLQPSPILYIKIGVESSVLSTYGATVYSYKPNYSILSSTPGPCEHWRGYIARTTPYNYSHWLHPHLDSVIINDSSWWLNHTSLLTLSPRSGSSLFCVYFMMTREDHALSLLTFDFVLGFMPSLGRTYILIVYEFPTPNLGTVSRLSIRFKWGTLIPHLSVLRLTSALGFGIYSLTWKTYILIVHEFPVPRLGPIPRLSVRLGEEHYSLIRLSSARPLSLTSRLINRATLSPFLTWTKKSLELYI